MAWIRTLGPDEATGELARLYRGLLDSDGTVDHVLSIHSLHPRSLRDHLGTYRTVMYGSGPLSRRERETIAVAVSAANACRY